MHGNMHRLSWRSFNSHTSLTKISWKGVSKYLNKDHQETPARYLSYIKVINRCLIFTSIIFRPNWTKTLSQSTTPKPKNSVLTNDGTTIGHRKQQFPIHHYKYFNDFKSKDNQWGHFQVCHQYPSQNQCRSQLWVPKWNESITTCQCRHPAANSDRRQTWSFWPNHEVHPVRHVGNSNTMGIPKGLWFNYNNSREFRSRSSPTVQQDTGQSTPDFLKSRNHGWGPQAPINWDYWR